MSVKRIFPHLRKQCVKLYESYALMNLIYMEYIIVLLRKPISLMALTLSLKRVGSHSLCVVYEKKRHCGCHGPSFIQHNLNCIELSRFLALALHAHSNGHCLNHASHFSLSAYSESIKCNRHWRLRIELT